MSVRATSGSEGDEIVSDRLGGLVPVVSVIIPAFDEAGVIADQLAAIARQAVDHPFEVLVADNGSTDGTRSVVRGFGEAIPYLAILDCSHRKGCGAAKNQATERARADLLLFCDADDVVAEGWLDAVTSALGDAGLVGGPSVTFTDHPSPFPNYRLRIEAPVSLGWLPFAEGCNMGVSAAAFRAVGGFDEAASHGEDVDLSWRVQLAGHRLVWVKEAVVHKRDRSDQRSLFGQFRRYGITDVYLYRKFRGLGVPQPSVLLGLRDWSSVLARIPLLVLATRRRAWAVDAGKRVGRIQGSIRHRSLCL